jgi:DNA-binding CsgD family transcriptional regulator
MRGFIALLRVDPIAARPLLERAAQAQREAGRPGPLVNALAMASITAHMTGDPASARLLRDEAQAVASGLEDVEARVAVLQALAFEGFLGGDPAAVTSASSEGARLSRESGDLYGLDIWLMNLGIAALIAGRPDEAKPLIAEALPIARMIDDRVSQFHLLDASACLAAGSGQARLAAQLLGAGATVGAGAGARLMPFLAPFVEQAESFAIAALGRPRFDAAFLAGSRLDRDAAVRLALGEPGEAVVTAPMRAGAGLLSKREEEVARLVADGLSNKEIGARLFISEHTVDSHVRAILNKLGFDSRARIAAWVSANE